MNLFWYIIFPFFGLVGYSLVSGAINVLRSNPDFLSLERSFQESNVSKCLLFLLGKHFYVQVHNITIYSITVGPVLYYISFIQYTCQKFCKLGAIVLIFVFKVSLFFVKHFHWIVFHSDLNYIFSDFQKASNFKRWD